MSPTELRASLSLAAIFGAAHARPVLHPAGVRALRRRPPGRDTSPWSASRSGAYGLTQAILQIPFGWLSDRCGRKPVIYCGLRALRRGQLRLRLGRDALDR